MYGSRVVLFHCDSKEYFDLKSRVRSPFPFSSVFGCSRSFRSSGRGARGVETTAATAAHTAKQTVGRAQRRQAAACARGGGDRRARAGEERCSTGPEAGGPADQRPRAAEAAQVGRRSAAPRLKGASGPDREQACSQPSGKEQSSPPRDQQADGENQKPSKLL